MASANHGHLANGWQTTLAGLQAGTAGTAAALLWLGTAAAWQRRSFWTAPNLMASTFYGDAAIRDGFGRSTVAGLALYFMVYGLLGVLFACLCAGRIRGLSRLAAGLLFGALWYYAAFWLLGKRFSPLITLLHAEKQTLAGHLLYGGILSRFERFVNRPTNLPSPAEP